MEQCVPSRFRPRHVEAKPNPQQRRTDQFDRQGNHENTAQQFSNIRHTSSSKGIGHESLLTQASRRAERQHDERREGHNPDAAQLDQCQDDDLPEKAEVIDRASDRQTGNANGARRSEHGIQPRDRILLRRTASGQSKNSTAGQH